MPSKCSKSTVQTSSVPYRGMFAVKYDSAHIIQFAMHPSPVALHYGQFIAKLLRNPKAI